MHLNYVLRWRVYPVSSTANYVGSVDKIKISGFPCIRVRVVSTCDLKVHACIARTHTFAIVVCTVERSRKRVCSERTGLNAENNRRVQRSFVKRYDYSVDVHSSFEQRKHGFPDDRWSRSNRYLDLYEKKRVIIFISIFFFLIRNEIL